MTPGIDIEALAKKRHCQLPRGHKKHDEKPQSDVRIAISRYALNLMTNKKRTQFIMDALQYAKIFSDLSQTPDDVEEYHPTEVKDSHICWFSSSLLTILILNMI